MEAQVTSVPASIGRRNLRLIACWAFTLFIAYENLDGAVWSFLRIGYVRADLARLGVPGYFLNIIGPGELCITVALLVPRFPVAKEWAYAGVTLNYSAALASHVFVGDRLFWIAGSPPIWPRGADHGLRAGFRSAGRRCPARQPDSAASICPTRSVAAGFVFCNPRSTSNSRSIDFSNHSPKAAKAFGKVIGRRGRLLLTAANGRPCPRDQTSSCS